MSVFCTMSQKLEFRLIAGQVHNSRFWQRSGNSWSEKRSQEFVGVEGCRTGSKVSIM